MALVAPPPPEVLDLLRLGRIEGSGSPLHGCNANFLIALARGGRTCRAIYKPQRGETPLWDFPQGTLYRREYLAFRVSEALGWGIVPPTVLRDGPYGIGSVQLFVDAVDGQHFFTLLERYRATMCRIALFDCLINNADRKGGHVLGDTEGRVWGIDHGLSLLAEPKLRTVMWDLRQEIIQPELKTDLARIASDAALRAALEEHLEPDEVAALYQRAACIAESKTIPFARYADAWRPYPWPPI
ncbi:MAG: SCO1664 family protein [Chloroflexi bacterium]|nr:SCO1664 family protein [Chloroflexota bacterium]